MTEGYHTAPVVSGDTLYALSRVLETQQESVESWGISVGRMRFQLIGLKNLRSQHALSKYGARLFVKECVKAREERIPEKIFEVEHTVLVRQRTSSVT